MDGSHIARPHETRAPAVTNAIDLYAGAWTTALPGIQSGSIDLTSDSRILELERLCGGFDGKRVLEIGALEGAHTFMMAGRGAKVTAIEADVHAYLRALIARQALRYEADLLLGNALLYDGPADSFDLVVCCGVLYHLMEPLALVDRLKAMAPRLYIWTHVYAPEVHNHPVAAHHFTRAPVQVSGVTHYPYDYAEALERRDFSGGFSAGARWITKDALLAALGGFHLTVFGEEMSHPHGPCLSIYAER